MITLSITHRMTTLDATVQSAYTEAPPTAIANVFGSRLTIARMNAAYSRARFDRRCGVSDDPISDDPISDDTASGDTANLSTSVPGGLRLWL
jgi:hypothetical protein